MKRYTLALAAGVPIPVEVGGEFFLLDSCPLGGVSVEFFGAGNLVRDTRIESGIEGVYARLADGFSSMRVTSAAPQTVAFYVARGQVGVNRFSGNLDVTDRAARLLGVASIDPNSARHFLFGDDEVNGDEAFVAYGSITALAANFSQVQVWNPAASGKFGYVDKITPQPGAAALFTIRQHNAALANAGNVYNKRLFAAAGAILCRNVQAAAAVGTQLMVVANQNGMQIELKPPIRLDPGTGVVVTTADVNIAVDIAMEFRERAAA